MRRALITNEFAPSHGGVEHTLHERAKGYQPKTLTVFCPGDKGCEEFDAAQPYAVQRTVSDHARSKFWHDVVRSLGPLRACWRAHGQTPFDLIECGQAFPAALFAWLMHRVRGTPYMVWVHGNDLLGPARYWPLRLALRRALGSAAAIISNSSYTANIVASFGVPAQRIRILPPSIDTVRFHPAPGSPILRDRYRVRDRRVILTVGRLVERKGVDLTLAALARVIATHKDVLYLIVGDGPQRAELEVLAWNLGIREHVVFCGAVAAEELSAHYHLASIFVMPSRYVAKEGSVEGLGLVYLEAMASGVPIIAGRSGGVTEIVHAEKTGLVVDPGSIGDLADAILRLLSDDDLVERLVRNGLDFVKQPRSWRVLDVVDPSGTEHGMERQTDIQSSAGDK